MSPARSLCAIPVNVAVCGYSVADSCKPANVKYRQQASILCPRGYEPRALPLRHAGEVLLVFMVARAMTIGFFKSDK